MPKRTTDEYFKIIKQNHKKYLDQNMVTHLELTGELENAERIKRYAENIKLYRPSKERYLDNAIQQLTTKAKVGHGALAALLGIGVGGLGFYAQKSTSVTDVINPLAGAKNIAAGVFSAAIGAGVGYVAYQAWKQHAKNPATDDYEQFQSAMQEAGFTNEKYNELSAELVKLFHFRECVLLGLKDGGGVNMREEFKKKFSPDGKSLDDEALNKAIEVYFLEQLNLLFNKAFQDIYKIQDEEIQDEIQHPMKAWIKSFFTNPAEREKFTQQMQIQFMDQCLNYLEAEMSEPSFFAKYPYATASITGLIGGAIALGLAAAILGGPITLGIAAIGLVAACLTGVAAYFAVNKIDKLHFKRSKDNRGAIKETIENVTKERERLNRLVTNAVETTPEDIAQLARYRDEGAQTGFLSYFNLFGKTKDVAMGAGSAWVREYASRYRHSKAIEIDLSAQEKEIIARGNQQTEEMQGLLKTAMTTGTSNKLLKFIKDTSEYLSNAEHHDFIQKFEVVEKIKQQFLDIVAVAPAHATLPAELISFYTRPVAEGGLGGLAQDLIQVRLLAPIVGEEVVPNEHHPLNHLLITAQRFNFALTQEEGREFILSGDNTYRGMLGLRMSSANDRIEDKIHAGNIQQYLDSSFDFLYSLNKNLAIDESRANLDRPIENSSEFILYRTLLIKQLASLADPNNLRVEPSVRRDIEKFAREKLHIDPALVFNEVLNNALFVQNDANGARIKDPLGNRHSLNNIEQIAEAIRVDLTYASTAMTPRMLIGLEAKSYLNNNATNKTTMFCYQNSNTELVAGELIPEATEQYVTQIKQTIDITKAFIAEMSNKKVLKTSGTLAIYIHDAHQEISNLHKQIVRMDRFLGNQKEGFNSEHLAQAEELLKAYQSELAEVLGSHQEMQNNMADSIVHYAGFGRENSITAAELFQEKTNAFIKDIDDYLEILNTEPEISRFNIINFSKTDKKTAAYQLRTALVDLQAGKTVELTFLDNTIYTNGRLHALVAKNLQNFSINTIKELFQTKLANSSTVGANIEEIGVPELEVILPQTTTPIDVSMNEDSNTKEVDSTQASALNDDDWVTIESPEPVRISADQIDVFIKNIDAYLEELKTQPEPGIFNFFAVSKRDKASASDELKSALNKLKAGESVDLTFLEQPIYKDNGLKKLISDNLTQLELKDINELAAAFDAVSVGAKIQG